MPHRSLALLKGWIADTVRPVPREATDHEAERLALEFRAYAEDAGFNPERLEEDFGEPLVDIMREALREKAAGPAADLEEDEEA